jgi:hypothetical protein
MEVITDYVSDIWPKIRFRVEYMEPDADTGDPELQCGRWWYVEDYFTKQDIVKAAWAALTMSDEHRRREGFRYKNAQVFSPHNAVELPR